MYSVFGLFFFQAEDGIRDLVRSRGLGDVYKRQQNHLAGGLADDVVGHDRDFAAAAGRVDDVGGHGVCLLYTSDAADERSSVDLGGRRIIKKKKTGEMGRSSRINKRQLTQYTTQKNT